MPILKESWNTSHLNFGIHFLNYIGAITICHFSSYFNWMRIPSFQNLLGFLAWRFYKRVFISIKEVIFFHEEHFVIIGIGGNLRTQGLLNNNNFCRVFKCTQGHALFWTFCSIVVFNLSNLTVMLFRVYTFIVS